jgi:type I restriction enzyme S subunit
MKGIPRLLPEVVEVNPRRFTNDIGDDSLVSFVPMKSVEEETGHLDAKQTRRWVEVKKGYTPFQDGDVLFAKITPCMENGKYALASNLHDGRAAGSTEFHVFRPKSDLDSKYLLFFLFSPDVRREAKRNMRGAAGQLRVPPIFFETLQIPLPPLDDQQRIVAEIEKQFTRLDAGIASLKRVQAALKRYRASVLKAACEGRLVPTEAELARKENRTYETGEQLLQRILKERREKWNHKGKYKELAAPEPRRLPTLPDGWTWTRLEQIGFVFGGLTKNPARVKLPNRVPYLRVANVYADELRLNDVEVIGVRGSELEKLLLKTGDLLIVEGNGSKDQIGRVAIWDGSIDPCAHQNHVIKVRLVEPRMARWVLYWLVSTDGRRFVELVASSTSGLYTLSVNKVANLPIPLPPMDEQQRMLAEIESVLSSAKQMQSTVVANLNRGSRLRASILQRSFPQQIV